MTTLISLSSLADPAAFLLGARVPLVRVAPNPLPEWAQPMTERMRSWLLSGSFEWRVDSAWRFDGDEGCRQEVNMEWTALDPSDPDVARLCDRRIAEALSIKEAKPWAFQSSSLIVIDGHVALAVAFDIHIRLWSPAQIHGAAAGVWSSDRIPEARVALVLALYGRKS